MRILLIEPSLTDNGAIRVSLDRAHRWQRQGAEVMVLVVSHDIAPGDHPFEPHADLPVIFATEKPQRLRYTIPIALLQSLRYARRADIVVAGREIDTGLLMAAAASRLGRPFAVTVQSNVESALRHYVSPRLQGPTLSALRRADLAVCVSGGVVQGITRIGVAQERTRVVYNGVDIQDVREGATRAPALLLPDEPFMVSTGRLSREKGFDLLVRAHADALEAGAPRHTLIILGEGPDRSALERLAAELGVAKSVQMPGFVANPHAVVGRADLFVLSSRWEGLSLSLVEALCIGQPVIAADCASGPSEVLRDGAYGALVPVEDVGALAAAITAHFADPNALRKRAEAGAADAAERFDPGLAAQQHLDLLTDLVKTRGRRTGN